MVPPFISGLFESFHNPPQECNETIKILKAQLQEATASRLREEAALADASKAKEAKAQSDEEASRLREVAALAEASKEAAVAEASEAKEALLRGVRPIVVPTPEETVEAMKRIEYDPLKLHFAVCGSSGSGKSSVINAVRGIRNKGDGAAGVGVTECTSEITRYPYPRKELPYSRFVWFDIPGAGTSNIPDWQYFNEQGLFVFDFIVMVYDVRFTTIDVGIIENCLRFNIPVLIVRSKADQHIANMIQSETNYEPGETEYDQVYQEMSARYVKETRADFNKHMDEMAGKKGLDDRDRNLIDNQPVYIISATTLRLFFSEAKADQKKAANRPIDELNLVKKMLRSAKGRRYPKTT